MPAKTFAQNTKHNNTDGTFRRYLTSTLPSTPPYVGTCSLQCSSHNKSPGPITRTRVLVPWCWCYSWSPPVSHGLVASSVISSCLIGITRSSKLGRGCGAQWRSAIGAAHDARFAAPSNPTLLIPNAASLRSRRQTREGGPVRPRQPIRSLFAPAGYLSTDNR